MKSKLNWYTHSQTDGLEAQYYYSMSDREMQQYCFIVQLGLNWDEYIKLNEVEPSDANGIVHYIKNWPLTNLIIPSLFNTHEYLFLNQDVLELAINPIEHYLRFGKTESRETQCDLNTFSFKRRKFYKRLESINLGADRVNQYSQEQLHCYFVLLNANVDWEHFAEYNDITHDGNIIAACLLNEDNRNLRIEGVFDASQYLQAYPDVKDAGFNPLVHFLSYGQQEGRSGLGLKDEGEKAKFALALPEHLLFQCEIIDEFDIDWSTFFESNRITDKSSSAIQYYVQNWATQDLIVPNVFDTNFYLDSYPDIRSIGMNPLLHFIQSGKTEGRVGLFELDDYLVMGDININPDLPNLAIVSHESSATGAPLVGINIGNALITKYNIFHILLRAANLNDDFVANSVATIADVAHKPKFLISTLLASLNKKYPLKAAICNSVETINLLEVLSEMHIPTLSLIHEFSEYTRPRGKIGNTVSFADRVIVPAELIRDSICDELVKCFAVKVQPNNIVVAPQGRLPFMPEGYGKNLTIEQLRTKLDIIDQQTKVFVAAGYVQIRKGTDLFVNIAQQIKEQYPGKCKFVWVGDGLDVEHDLAYSVWVQKQIDESGLGNDIVFLDYQKNLDNVLAIADVFMMTSRLDPFPNVVIDALAADVHVACFRKSTGCAEFLLKNNANASVAKYLDTHDMADKIVDYLCNDAGSNAGVNKTLIKQKLAFNDYIECIEGELEKAMLHVKERIKIEKSIEKSNAFDADFFGLTELPENALSHYVKCALKGIHVSNPNPGFYDAQWLQVEGGNNPYQVPMYEAIKRSQPLHTHSAVELVHSDVSHKLKIAVHLHLYYFELKDVFAEYFSELTPGYDLYITVCNEESNIDIRDAFKNSGAKSVNIVKVPNEGRDVAPFFSSLKNELYKSAKYDVVGHFHSKKSADSSDDVGDNWRTYLLDNLVGKRSMNNALFDLFDNAKLGLIFASDHHVVDFGENKQFACDLAEAMSIEPMEFAHLFPLGTMFWARPKALSNLFELDWHKFIQPEPLPYDGSYMHASERLLPHVAKHNGFEFKSIYCTGTNW